MEMMVIPRKMMSMERGAVFLAGALLGGFGVSFAAEPKEIINSIGICSPSMPCMWASPASCR